MKDRRQPWLKFYPTDWRGDPRLRMCSYAARGLWIDLISYMHEGEPYGHLTIDGIVPDVPSIAALTGRPIAETKRALMELAHRQVFSKSESGAIYSRRMVRDNAKAIQDRLNGKGGGNPNLLQEDKQGVNPPDKAQKLEARDQKLESKNSEADASGADAPIDPSIAERELFEKGKQVLGKSAGGQIVKLLKAKGGNVALARAAIEAASTKENPGEYIARIAAGPPQGSPQALKDQKTQEWENARAALRESIARDREGETIGGSPVRLLSEGSG